jgi:5'-nucleotidase (lipoprotein e(P4) family)
MKQNTKSNQFEILSAIMLLTLATACHKPKETASPIDSLVTKDDQIIMSILYQQKAAEYRALCLQAYNLAKRKVDEAVRNNELNKSIYPLAVVTDLDETALNNSANEVQSYLNDSSYSPKQFIRWCKLGKARSVPGSIPFFRYVDSIRDRHGKKIDIFYVSNRDSAETLDATVGNMTNWVFLK